MARRLFFVHEVREGHAVISGDDAHHLTRVLRVEPGQKYEISDNQNVYLAEVESARKDEVSFTILEKLAARPQAVRIALYIALIRFERLEWLIEKAAELGVESIHPFAAQRSEQGLAVAAPKRLDRWRRIAREASEQSRRSKLPELSPPLGEAPAIVDGFDYRFVCDELPGARPLLAALPRERRSSDRLALLIGPEGGWTDRERDTLASAWQPVSLGANILRAETAALAALAIVQAAFS